MSDFGIEQAIHDAEIYALQDQTRRSALEITQDAQKLLVQTEQALSKCGKQLEKAEKSKLKQIFLPYVRYYSKQSLQI